MADLHLGELIDLAPHKRNGTPTVVATGDLTTHGVIVGMTGSGKTGVGIVLIEEALTGGVPCLLVDPKGDLTNRSRSAGWEAKAAAVEAVAVSLEKSDVQVAQLVLAWVPVG